MRIDFSNELGTSLNTKLPLLYMVLFAEEYKTICFCFIICSFKISKESDVFHCIKLLLCCRLSVNFILLKMPNHEVASHCLVRWEDDASQFAVVDTKRSKSVSTLKIGLTTCFEGFQRERRRGTILFLGKSLH